LYYLTKEMILELLNREIRKANGIATNIYRQELIEIKQNFIDCLETYNIELKNVDIVRDEDLV